MTAGQQASVAFGGGVRITAQTVSFTSSALSTICNYNVETIGVISKTGGPNTGPVRTVLENWINPTSLAPGAYWAKAVLNSGTTPGGSAMNTQIALSGGTVSWGLSTGTTGTISSNFTVSIGIGSTTLSSAVIVLNCTHT